MDGRLFSLPDVLRGSPAGSAPFLLLMIAGSALGGILGALTSSMSSAILEIGGYVLWLTAIWIFMWSLGRLASSMGVTVKAARAIHMIFMVVFIMIIPMFVLIASAGRRPDVNTTRFVQYVSPFSAIQRRDGDLLVTTGIAWGGLGVVITIISEAARKKNAKRPPVIKNYARPNPPPSPPPFLP